MFCTIIYIDKSASCTILQRELQPFSKGQILDTSKLKEFADDNFKLDDNGRVLQKHRKH